MSRVVGVVGLLIYRESRNMNEESVFVWAEGEVARVNYEGLGKRLARSIDLFRDPQLAGGLIRLLPNGKYTMITKGAELLPVIVDRVDVIVMRDGKVKGSRINAADLNAMLRSEVFLREFIPVDLITSVPMYLPDFSLTKPGFNEGGPGHRIFYLGSKADPSDDMEAINAFLDVMPFASIADRTNAVGAALIVLLRNHWPGGKPILYVTANKSHSGKDTILAFATGTNKSVSISYQATNWAFEQSFVTAVKSNPGVALVVVENARLDGKEMMIASAFLERFVTDPEPQLFSPGTGTPIRVPNYIVVGVSTNFGLMSDDGLNRALPMHLELVGNIEDRYSPIGNPKLEYLPANRDKIAAELHGMIERWDNAGQPLDERVKHLPFGPCAAVIGGILKVNGFTDFLANYGKRKSADNPLRKGLGILGAEHPDVWLTCAEWAKRAINLGLEKTLISPADRGTEAGRKRGIGVILSSHQDESLTVETDDGMVTLRLEKQRRRWGKGEGPKVKYEFKCLNKTEVGLKQTADKTADGTSTGLKTTV